MRGMREVCNSISAGALTLCDTRGFLQKPVDLRKIFCAWIRYILGGEKLNNFH